MANGKAARKRRQQEYDRVAINQLCLLENVLPRLESYPAHRSDKWRQTMRVVINHLVALVEGNNRYLEEHAQSKRYVKRFGKGAE